MSFTLSTIDFVILAAYLALICWMGFRHTKKNVNAEEFFLAGRTLAWPVVGLSLYASNMSSSSIIGLSSSGYKYGVSVFSYEWVGVLILIFFAVYIVPLYLRSKVFTMPEFLEKRFDARSRYYFSSITIIANLAIDTAGSLFAGSLVLQMMFPEAGTYTLLAGLAVLSGLYTLTGGLRAVVYTDVIQGIVLTLGSLLVAVLAFNQIGSWSNLTEMVSPDKLQMIRPADDEFLPWPALILGLPILGFYYWCTNQHIVQRMLGAKSIDQGRKGALFAGALKLTVVFTMVLPGTMALAMYPELEDPNQVFPMLMLDLLPVGIMGIVLTGFIAALMSSIDSALNSASTLATMDLYQKYRPQTDTKGLMFAGRLFIILFILAASFWTPFIDQYPSLWEYLQAALSYLTPPVVVCFISGMFWRRATADGAFYALISGAALGVVLLVTNLTGITQIHYLYVAVLLFAFSFSVMFFTSLYTLQPVPEQLTFSYFNNKELIRPKKLSFKIQAALLTAVTFFIVYLFL